MAQEHLFTVGDKMVITGRGVVIIPSGWHNGQVKTGDWVEIRSTEGGMKQARIRSVEAGRKFADDVPAVERGLPGMLLWDGITSEDVQRGDEVWSIDELTQD